jgi:ferredoxin
VAAAEPDEDEDLSLDDPYIDTPLCTACDDCTKMSPMVFAYNENKQAYIKDASAGSYKDLVLAAEKCPVKIIHPGKPMNPNEEKLDEWIKRAEPFR